MDENTRTVLIAAIAAIVTLGSAYIGARWQLGKTDRKNAGKNGGNPVT